MLTAFPVRTKRASLPLGLLPAAAIFLVLSACANQQRWDYEQVANTTGYYGLVPYLVVYALSEITRPEGRPGEPALAESVAWSTVCDKARDGDGVSRVAIAWHYRNGWAPASVNPIEAYKWFTLAASAGNADAEQYRTALASELPSDQIAEAERRATAWSAETEDCVAVAATETLPPSS